MTQIVQPTSADKKELLRVRDKLDGAIGEGAVYVKHSREGLVIGVNLPKPPATSRERVNYGRVVSSLQDGSNYRWTYTMERVEKTDAGFGGWTKVEDSDTVTAFNTLEDMNGAGGMVGIGVDVDDLRGTYQPVPAPAGAILRIDKVFTPEDEEDGPDEWAFEFSNSVDGSC